MRLKAVFGAALFAACGASPGAAVHAADLAPYYGQSDGYVEPEQPLEFGSGWYLRGDGGFSEEDRPKLDVSTGTFNRDATQVGYSLGLGAGYKFNSYLRADLTGDYLGSFDDKAQIACGPACTAQLSSNVERWDGLANAYLDLGTWFGVTPYVGGGVGVSGTHQSGSVEVSGGSVGLSLVNGGTGTLTSQTLPSQTGYQFAWAAMAGFSYAFAPHALLDVNYRYLDLGSATIQLYPLASVRKGLVDQQVRAGIRYMID